MPDGDRPLSHLLHVWRGFRRTSTAGRIPTPPSMKAASPSSPTAPRRPPLSAWSNCGPDVAMRCLPHDPPSTSTPRSTRQAPALPPVPAPLPVLEARVRTVAPTTPRKRSGSRVASNTPAATAAISSRSSDSATTSRSARNADTQRRSDHSQSLLRHAQRLRCLSVRSPTLAP